MSKSDPGFTILEMLAAVIVMGILVAMALPEVLTAVKACRLHADAAVAARDPAIDLSGVYVRL